MLVEDINDNYYAMFHNPSYRAYHSYKDTNLFKVFYAT